MGYVHSDQMSRRQLLTGGLGFVSVWAMLKGTWARAADPKKAATKSKKVSPEQAKEQIELLKKDQMAQGLQYYENAADSPARKGMGPAGETRFCCNCDKYADKTKGKKCKDPDGRAVCSVIPAAPVRAAGYCLSWQEVI